MTNELQKIARNMLFMHGYVTRPWDWANNASQSATPKALRRSERDLVTTLRTLVIKSAVVNDRGDRVRGAFEHATPRNPDSPSEAGGCK